VGSDLGLHVSFDGGGKWVRMHLGNLPPVAVRDITIHPRDNDLILGTHGRSIWILDDVTPLQEINDQVVTESAFLFSMRPALRFDGGGGRGGGLGQGGNKPFAGPNPPFGAAITYYLKDSGPAQVEVLDAAGKTVRELGKVPQEAGLNRVVWDLRYQGPHSRAVSGADAGDQGGFGFPARGPLVLPGKYTVKLTAGGKTLTRELEVKVDPTIPVTSEALHTQLDVNLKLRDMQSSVNDALRGIDSYKGQIDSAQKTVRALDPQATRLLASLLNERLQQLSTMELKLARPGDIPGYSMAPRLVDRLSALLNAIDRVLDSPTPYQMEHFNELRAEFLADVGDVNKFVEKQIPEINDLLKKNNAGALMAGKPLEIPASIK
jgi:hypothetical protein